MTVLYIEDFKLGLDVRKDVLTAQPGSLQQLDNAVIDPGGAIVKAKAWVQVATLATGMTIGLYGTNSGTFGTEQLWVFAQGSGAPTKIADLSGAPFGQTVQLWMGTLQPPAGVSTGAGSLMEWAGCREYGPGQFFVSAGIWNAAHTAPSIYNWWNGVVVPSYVGYHPLASGQKMYRVGGSVIYFSGLGDPSDTNPLNPGGTGPNTVHPGAGFIDTSRLSADTNFLIGLAPYYKQVAAFSRSATLIFAMDPDPSKNDLSQTLATGAWSGNSIVPIGTGEIYFLARAGVRSLRSLSSGLQAGIADVGAPIDTLLAPAIANGTFVGLYAPAVHDITTGRYMIAIGNTMYILSSWPSSKITAWSAIPLPFTVDQIVTAGSKIFARAGDVIYQYGGADGLQYDTRPATVRTPLHPAGTPMTKKKSLSIAAEVQGNWAMSVCMDPDNPTIFEPVANLTRTTYAQETIPFSGFGSHIGFKLTCSDAAASKIGGISVRFDKSTEL